MAEKQPIITKDAKLAAALENVRQNRSAAAEFAKNPSGFLKSAGVDTSNLKFGTSSASGELTDADMQQVAGGWTGCASLGCVACGTVGN